MGWSLGGLLAQGLAQALPERVRGLLLVASTPCFAQKHTGHTVWRMRFWKALPATCSRIIRLRSNVFCPAIHGRAQ
ncbi:MAG: hypothetical protein R3E89_10725 [Thiolinea sp.]